MNWDTIKLFLALYREGSARAVAQEQGVSASTVTRRISDLEAELGTRLFNRHSAGFELTEAGRELLHVALRMESDAYEIERRLQAKAGLMQGRIRVTVPTHLLIEPFMHALAEFSQKHPGINFDVLPSYDTFDLSRGEADIALRIMLHDAVPPETLIAHKLVDIYCAAYASQKYVEAHDLSDSEVSNWVGWADEGPYPDWVLSSAFPHLPAKHRFNDTSLQLYAAKTHMGLVMMPCFLCDSEPDLIRVDAGRKWHRFNLWMLSHPDLRDTLRFKEFRRYLKTQFSDQSSLWAGDPV